MTAPSSEAPKLPSLAMIVSFIARSVGLLVMVILVFSDLQMPSMIEISDYTTTFYTAGKLISSGRLSEVYPAPTDKGLMDTTFDKASHTFLSNLPKTTVSIFPYPPLVGSLFVPLSLLPANISLLVFQALSMFGIGLSAAWLGSIDGSAKDRLFFMTFLFTPVVLILWIGQVDILAGLTVYAACFYLLHREKHFLAGLLAALTLLKLQLALVPFFIAGVLLLSKRQWRMTSGLLLGSALFVAANVLIFGVDACKAWLGAMKLTEAVYLDPTAGVAKHLAVSIPRFILFLAAPEMVPKLRPIVYGVSATMLLISLAVCCRFALRNSMLKSVSVALIVSSMAIPLVAPHLFYYDLCVFMVAGYLIFGKGSDGEFGDYLRPRARILWILMSIYPFLFAVNKTMYLPLIILIPLLYVYCGLLFFLWRQGAPGDSSANAQQYEVDNALQEDA